MVWEFGRTAINNRSRGQTHLTSFVGNRTLMPAPRKRQSPSSLRDQFFRSIAAESGCHVLFDHIPGVAFFAKDRHSRLVAANRQFYERLGFRSERELIGKDDFALFPLRLAEH